jgi:hypothetical protein
LRGAWGGFDQDIHAYDTAPLVDRSRYSTTGTVDNSSSDISTSTLRYGKALTFSGDATNDRVDLGSISSSHILSYAGERQMTFFVVARYGGTPSSTFPRIFDMSNAGGPVDGYTLSYDTSAPRFGFVAQENSNTLIRLFYNYTLSSGEVFTLGGTLYEDGSTVTGGQLYFNGIPVSTTVEATPALTGFTSNTHDMAIGNWNHATDRMWDGEIAALYMLGGTANDDFFRELHRDPFGPFRLSEDTSPIIQLGKGAGNFTILGPAGYPMPPYASFSGKAAAGAAGGVAGSLASMGVGI